VTDIVFGVGFQAQNISVLQVPSTGTEATPADLRNYCTKTGQLFGTGSNLFGCGIAFPHDFIDEEGDSEPWVGFKRSIEQVDSMLAASR
jgi:hypothetical protein